MASATFLQTAVSTIALSSETEGSFDSTNFQGQRHISRSASCPASVKHLDDEALCADSTPDPPRSPAPTESTLAASLTDDCGHASSTGYSSDDLACESSSEEEEGAPRRRHMPFSSIFPEREERWAGDVDPPRASPEYDEVSARRSRLDIFEQYGLFGAPPGTWQRPKDACEQAVVPCPIDEPQHDDYDVPASVQRGRMILERYGVFGASCGAWSR